MSRESSEINENDIKNSENQQPKESQQQQVILRRPILNQNELVQISGYERPRDKSIQKTISGNLKNVRPLQILLSLIPVLQWLPKYSIKSSLINDIIAGVTVAIMHIPQGMAYGLLAGVDPVGGMYLAFFPTIIYFFFGTSRHVSTGTFAVVSIMTSKIVTKYSNQEEFNYTPFQVATAVTLMCGFIQILMGLLRIGKLSSLLSDALISGFTTATAIHVLIAQITDVLGVKIKRQQGPFKIIFSVIEIGKNLHTINHYTLMVSAASIIFLIFMNEIVKPYFAKRCRFPIPSELLAVLGFTSISYFLNLGDNYGIREVGTIPTGLPYPELPPVELLKDVAVDAIAISIVSYSIIMSMALIFARKDQYEIHANQELFALGLSNIFGSFFSCIPLACSLSRSVIQYETGGKTQIASLVSAGIILIVLLLIGPLFETLPRATLGSIIIVALKNMFMQVKDVKKFKNEGFMELTIWMVTFVSVIVIDLDVGLLLGFITSLVAFYMKGFKSYSSLLGNLPNTEIYIDIKSHKGVVPVPKIKIFHYAGSINFVTQSGFKNDLMNSLEINEKEQKISSLNDSLHEMQNLNNSKKLSAVIVDFSAVLHIDLSGCKMLLDLQNSLKSSKITLLIANINSANYDVLVKASKDFQCFPTVHDAVLFSQTITETS